MMEMDDKQGRMKTETHIIIMLKQLLYGPGAWRIGNGDRGRNSVRKRDLRDRRDLKFGLIS